MKCEAHRHRNPGGFDRRGTGDLAYKKRGQGDRAEHRRHSPIEPGNPQADEELRHAGWRATLLAEYLIGPCHKRHQIRRRYKPSILAVEVAIADRTGP